MKWRRRPVVAWVLPALLVCGAAAAPPASDQLVKTAGIHLKDRLAALGKPRMGIIRVDATSFSPDASRLAIVFSDGSDSYVLKVHPEPAARYLLVVPVSNPETTIYWRDLTGFNLLWASLSGGTWSPDGNSSRTRTS